MDLALGSGGRSPLCNAAGSFPVSHRPQSDTELTNLNWVAGAPVPMQNPVSPTRKAAAAAAAAALARGRQASQQLQAKDEKAHHWAAGSCTTPKLTPSSGGARQGGSGGRERGRGEATASRGGRDSQRREKARKSKREGEDEAGKQKKPNCSYTSLIGLALIASEDGCLPVSEIYNYIEEEFPYFKTAPDGWKNSIRHNLSLNPAFRKVKDSLRWQGKKGYYWEVVPERWSSVEREVERYLRQEGKLRSPELTNEIASFPSCLQASIPTMPQTPCPMPMCSFQFCTGTQPYYDIASSMLRYFPPPPSSLPPPPSLPPPSSLPPPPLPPTSAAAYRKEDIPLDKAATLLDTDLSPAQFAGFSDPAHSSASSALHDLFNLHLSPPHTVTSSTIYTLSNSHTQCSSSQKAACVQFQDCASRPSPTSHSMRLRKQALDQLVLPEDNNATPFDWTSHNPGLLSKLHPDPTHFSRGPAVVDHCMTLDECFVSDGSRGSGEGVEGEDCGELPLPPRPHSRSLAYEDRLELTREGERGAISSGASPSVTSSDCGVPARPSGEVRKGCKRRGEKGRRKKKRRISTTIDHKHTTTTFPDTGAVAGGRIEKKSSCNLTPELYRIEEGETDSEEKGEMIEKGVEVGSKITHNCFDNGQTMRETLFHGVVSAMPCLVTDGSYGSPNSAHHYHHKAASFRSCHEVC